MTVLPSAWRGCSRSRAPPTHHLTVLCSGSLLGTSFHQVSPEERREWRRDQTEGKILCSLNAESRTMTNKHTPTRTHTHTQYTCSMGIPNSALSLLWAALLTPIASFSSSSLSVCRGWLQHVFVKQPEHAHTQTDRQRWLNKLPKNAIIVFSKNKFPVSTGTYLNCWFCLTQRQT